MNTNLIKNKKFEIYATEVIRLPESDSGPNNNIVRVQNLHMPNFKRWTAVCITNKQNGHSTIRYVIGSNSLKGLTLKTLGIDYDAMRELEINNSQKQLNLVLRKATFWQIQKWLWQTPNLNNRYGNYWGVLGTVLGILGILGSFL